MYIFGTMITQHLYTTDAVSATFLSSFFEGNETTATQCAKELLVSGETPRLRRLVTFAWLCDTTYNTAHRVNAFCQWNESPDAFLRTLLSERRVTPVAPDPPVIPPVPYETHALSPWTVPPSDWTAGQATTVWRAVRDALRHRNMDRAMVLTAYLVVSHTPSVHNLLTALGVREEIRTVFHEATPDLAIQALRLAYASLVCTEPEHSVVSATVERILTTHLPYGRAGRTFTISAKACAEWKVPIPPESDLMGPPAYLRNGTAFWNAVLQTYRVHITSANEVQCPNDEMLEAFYTAYFPDDIPDEWTAAERQKSHGVPMQERASTALTMFRHFLL